MHERPMVLHCGGRLDSIRPVRHATARSNGVLDLRMALLSDQPALAHPEQAVAERAADGFAVADQQEA